MFKNYKNVLNRVLDEIRPNSIEKNRLEFLSKKVLEIASREAAKYNATSMLAGSLTRDTWLTTKKEFDVFIIFPKTLSVEKLEKVGLGVGKKIIGGLKGEWRIEYAQHPYVRGKVYETEIDIVPCYKKEEGEKKYLCPLQRPDTQPDQGDGYQGEDNVLHMINREHNRKRISGRVIDC